MSTPLDTQSIIDETNRVLVKDFRIDPSDPIVANVILNQVVLGRYIDEINQTLDIHHKRLLKALETEEESARRIASKVITQSADYLTETIKASSQSQEEQLATKMETNRAPSHWAQWLYGLAGLGIGVVISLFFG